MTQGRRSWVRAFKSRFGWSRYVVVPGVLQRLFTFAKSTKARPLENFTTEALAAAIRRDPSVFVGALADLGLAGIPAEIGVASVETQVHVPGGVVDLVAEFVLDGRSRSFWVEVKAHAGLHGPQLQNYCDAAEAYPASAKPIVLMLCKRPLTHAVPTLRWNRLRDLVVDESHIYWHDLRRFLEDNRMADDFDRPITPTELEVVPVAHALLRKTARMAREFLSSLPKDGDWASAEFPGSEGKVIATIAQQFRQHQRLVTHSKRYPWVNFGLTFTPVPRLEVWIEFRPTDFEARDAVFAVAKANGLSEGWSMRPEGCVVARAM